MATTPVDLQEALQSGATDIEVRGELTGMPMVTLPPGVRLRGGTLRFDAKGVRLTRDNVLEDVTVVTEPDEVAILNDTTVTDLGTLTLRNVNAVGQVLLVAADSVRSGHGQVDGLTISNAGSSEVGNSHFFWAGRSLDLVISHFFWSQTLVPVDVRLIGRFASEDA